MSVSVPAPDRAEFRRRVYNLECEVAEAERAGGRPTIALLHRLGDALVDLEACEEALRDA